MLECPIKLEFQVETLPEEHSQNANAKRVTYIGIPTNIPTTNQNKIDAIKRIKNLSTFAPEN